MVWGTPIFRKNSICIMYLNIRIQMKIHLGLAGLRRNLEVSVPSVVRRCPTTRRRASTARCPVSWVKGHRASRTIAAGLQGSPRRHVGPGAFVSEVHHGNAMPKSNSSKFHSQSPRGGCWPCICDTQSAKTDTKAVQTAEGPRQYTHIHPPCITESAVVECCRGV